MSNNNNIFEVSIKGRGHRAKRIAITPTKSEGCETAARLANLFRMNGTHAEISVTPVYGPGAESALNSVTISV